MSWLKDLIDGKFMKIKCPKCKKVFLYDEWLKNDIAICPNSNCDYVMQDM